MHCTLPAFFYLTNLSLTLAITLPNPINSTANTTFTPPSRYYLKTSVIGDGNADKNGLYVSSHHTGPLLPLSSLSHIFHSVKRHSRRLLIAIIGPGLSDATLLPFSTVRNTVGFLNDTHQQFDLHSSVPFGMIMEPSENLDVGSFIASFNRSVTVD